MELPSTFKDLLTMIGSPLFIGVILSVLLVRWQWFVNLGNKTKFWLTGLVCILPPILSRILVLYLPVGAVDFIEQWYPTVLIGAGVWVSSQAWNKLFGANGAVSKAQTIKQINAPVKEK
jgi:hypothetical protein